MAVNCMYVYMALLLLVGTQLATSKSVDETFTDDLNRARTLGLSKREAAGEDKPETTTILDTESTTPEESSSPTPAKPSDEDPASTSSPELEEEEDEAPTTVKPLSSATTAKPPKSKQKKPKPTSTPPTLLSRIDPLATPSGVPTIGPGPVLPGLLIPGLPPPTPYVPPYNYFPPPAGPSFGPWPLNPPQLTPVVNPAPYDYPHPSGPAFSETPSNSAFAGSFASASASAGGNGGSVSTSVSPGGGVSSSSSHSGQPGGVVSAQQSASSFSNSGGPFPGAAGLRPQAPAGGNVNLRGSFGDDDESVGIEVNGPESAGGVPAYANAGANYPSNAGQGYAGGAYAPNPYQNTIPQYGAPPYNPYSPQFNSYPNAAPYNPYPNPNQIFDFQEFFRRIQAQNLEFQRQINAQIEAHQRAGGTTAFGGASITNDQGAVDPKGQVFVNTRTSANSASASASVDSGSGIGGAKSTVLASPTSNNNDNNRIFDQFNQVDSRFGDSAPAGGSSANGPQSAVASASFGPQGGYLTGAISPTGPNILNRFAETLPPSSGNSVGVFSSSSSSSFTGPDGKPVSRKTVTTGVNDNGKVTIKTVHDP